jgi:lipopolysaccharide/colanic/teichoic acid biosynthesis glycosyltransferase
MEAFLGDGTRWGSQFTFHLARDSRKPYAMIRSLLLQVPDEELILLGHGDRLPAITLPDSEHTQEAGPALFGSQLLAGGRSGREWQWNGWALLTAAQCRALPGEQDELGLADHLQTAFSKPLDRITLPRPLDFHTVPDLLATCRTVLDSVPAGLQVSAREVEPGIWLSRNVVLHPDAEVLPPVIIGENCHIEAGATVGPYTVLAEGCVIDCGARLAHTVVCPHSYVGAGVEAKSAIVDEERIVRATAAGSVQVTTKYAVASLTGAPLAEGAARVLAVMVGITLSLLALPLLAGIGIWLWLFRKGPVFFCQQIVQLPAPPNRADWSTYNLLSFCTPPRSLSVPWRLMPTFRDFLLRFLPALLNVARGNLWLVGVSPRTPEQISSLGPHWQPPYLRTRAGLITVASLMESDATLEEVCATDAAYAATANWRRAFRVAVTYFLKVVGGKRPSQATESPRSSEAPLIRQSNHVRRLVQQ